MKLYSIPMGKAVRKAKAFFDGALRGVEAPADTFIVNEYAYPHESPQEAMRQDWERVGDELRKSIKQADVKAAA